MGTDNRRVAAYLPASVDEKLIEFKIKNGLASEDKPQSNDSKALILILQEYFGVSQEVAYSVTHKIDLKEDQDFQSLKEQVVTLENELISKLEHLEKRIENLDVPATRDVMLSTGELAKRLRMNSSTLSHWKSSNPKKGKSPDELLKATRSKDPDGIGWQFDDKKRCFYPEKNLTSDSSVFQGDLLNAGSENQVNPERSEP